jgi:hypothetical protein
MVSPGFIKKKLWQWGQEDLRAWCFVNTVSFKVSFWVNGKLKKRKKLLKSRRRAGSKNDPKELGNLQRRRERRTVREIEKSFAS